MTAKIKVEVKALDQLDAKPLKGVFSLCFTEPWASSIPFPNDPVLIAKQGEKVVGFCMVHDRPPYEFKTGKGVYMYNLCVAPKMRKHGVGTALMDALKERYTRVHTHMLITDPYHEWLVKRSFVEVDVWKGHRGYTYDKAGVKPPAKKEPNPQLDDDEIVVYMD